MAGKAEEYPTIVHLKRKKLRYHIAKRANLEVETILSNFWEEWGTRLEIEELEDLERILEMDDLEFLDVFWGRKELPEGCSQSLFVKIVQCWKERPKDGR